MGIQITEKLDIREVEEKRKILAARELAREIRRLREAAKLNQDDIAERVGLTQSSISDLEKETYTFPIDNVVRVAKAFGLSPHYFLAVYLGEDTSQFTNKDKQLLDSILDLVKEYLKTPEETAPAPIQTVSPIPVNRFVNSPEGDLGEEKGTEEHRQRSKARKKAQQKENHPSPNESNNR